MLRIGGDLLEITIQNNENIIDIQNLDTSFIPHVDASNFEVRQGKVLPL